jgi:histidyl-tRNA synthetase
MAKEPIRSVKGTQDILPNQTWRWQKLETALHDHHKRYGYREIRTPAFERSELFARGVGEDTDIVSKEMYSWKDQGEVSLTLKPELTAPVVRAFIQNNIAGLSPVTRLYYIDALFRRERPQKGRYRQFHQFGAEVLGSPHPEADVEIITIAYELFKGIGLENLELRINSIGSAESRASYRDEFKKFLKPHHAELSEVSQKRFHKNPLRILDTKIPREIEILKDSPRTTDYLTEPDREHFHEVTDLLDLLQIPCSIDHRMVRGLDYYTHTTFEITSSALGAQDALCGGGRYDDLVENLGGSPAPAVGFAAGMERTLLALESISGESEPSYAQVYIISLDDLSRGLCFNLAAKLRNRNISAETDLLRRSLKAQMRDANKSQARIAVIIGQSEIESGRAQVKDLKTGEQVPVKIDLLVDHLAGLEF